MHAISRCCAGAIVAAAFGVPGYSSSMNAVWLDVPEEFLEERRRLGHDKRDELWEGVLHMVPPGSSIHGSVADDLVVALMSIAKRRGLLARSGHTGVFNPNVDKSYRIPDVSVARRDQFSDRGLEGAELVVEVLSPNDESRQKFPFYARIGVREIWLIDPKTRATEIYKLSGQAYTPVAFEAGIATSPVLGITLEVIAGPLLRLRDGDEIADV
jgi:Uma2 family endonuclease